MLASLVEARRPRSAGWEVVVVDNGCGEDDTSDVCRRFERSLPLRRISEPRVGLSHARNAAVRDVQGDCILWTDDDVTIGADWLTAYEAAIANDPATTFFGGTVLPRFEGRPPAWLTEGMAVFASSYAGRQPSPDDGPLDAATVELPFGANFWADPHEAQRRHAYDGALGRQPGRFLIGGEEIALMRQLLSEGARGRWVPAAEVEHWIGPDRQTIAYLRAYWGGQGWVAMLQASQRGEPAPGLLAQIRAVFRTELDYRVARRRGDRSAEARALIVAATARGSLAYRYWRPAHPERVGS